MSDNVELEMLRAFYISWVDLHKIPRDKLHRHKMEAQAQLLVDNAHALKAYYKSEEKPKLEVVQ